MLKLLFTQWTLQQISLVYCKVFVEIYFSKNDEKTLELNINNDY